VPSLLANAHADTQVLIRDATASSVVEIWNNLPDHSDRGVELFIPAATALVDAGQRNAISLADGYFAQEMDRPAYGLDADRIIAMLRGSTDPEEVYRRGFVTLWTAFKNRTGTYEQVNPRVVQDIIARVKIDMLLAATHAAREVSMRDPRVYGLWRVSTGTCDLCEDALAMATPQTGLMPVHPGCECAFEPITSKSVARSAARGANIQRALSITRIGKHGEYGPTLEDASFSGTDLTAKAIDSSPPTVTGHAAIRDALKEMGQVHRLPESFPRSFFDVETRVTTKERLGYFAPATREVRLTQKGLKYGDAYRRSIVTHEAGHALDNGFVRMIVDDLKLPETASRGFVSELPHNVVGLEQVSEDIRDAVYGIFKVMDAIKESRTFRGLTDLTARKVKEGKITSDQREYVLSDKELFARAYSQYIAAKRDRALFSDDAYKLERSVGTQWADYDFAPIERAFDDLFKTTGLAKQTRKAMLKGRTEGMSEEAVADWMAELRRGGARWEDVRAELGVVWSSTKCVNIVRKYGYSTKGVK